MAIYSDLKQILSPPSEVVLATNTNRTSALSITQRWNGFEAPEYAIYAKPGSNEEIKKFIIYAAEQSVPFLATGGGNGYTSTTGAIRGGISIDLGYFLDVHVNAVNNRMTVGVGVIFNDVFEPLHVVGKKIQTGSCSCVGVLEIVLGGGIGPYQGVYGLLLDDLESVTIVTGSGEIATASAEENIKLFWGLRGGGHNFGVVTLATFRVHDQTNAGMALNGDSVYRASSKEANFDLVKSLAEDQPDELSLFGMIMFDRQTHQTVLMMSAIYVGPEEKGIEYIRRPTDHNPLRQSGGDHSILGLNLHEFGAATFLGLVDKFDNSYAKNPTLIASTFVLELFPNTVIRRMLEEATTYPYRDAMGYTFISFVLPDAASAAVAEQFGQATRNELVATGGRNGSLEVYVNYAHGDEGQVAWYLDRKLPRLRALKSRWDPRGLFNWSNGITQKGL